MEKGDIDTLLVEDDHICAYVTKKTLEELGCNVDVAKDASEAYACLQNNHYDIVFLDIGLPDKDGFELTKEVRNNLQLDLPIIALTGHVANRCKDYFSDKRIDDFIYKPASKSVLQSIIQQHVILC